MLGDAFRYGLSGGGLRTLAFELVRAGTARRAAPPAQRIPTAVLLAAVAALAATASIGCLAVAVWLFALPHAGPDGAFLIVALVLLLAGGVLALVARSCLRRDRRHQAAVEAAAIPDPDLMLRDAGRLFRANKATMLLAALVAGLVSGNRTVRGG